MATNSKSKAQQAQETERKAKAQTESHANKGGNVAQLPNPVGSAKAPPPEEPKLAAKFNPIVKELKPIFSYLRGAWQRLLSVAESFMELNGTAEEWSACVKAAGGTDGTNYTQYVSRIGRCIELGVSVRHPADMKEPDGSASKKAGAFRSYGELGPHIQEAAKAQNRTDNRGSHGNHATGPRVGAKADLTAALDTVKIDAESGKARAVGEGGGNRPILLGLKDLYGIALAALIEGGTNADQLAGFVKADVVAMKERFAAWAMKAHAEAEEAEGKRRVA